MKRSQKWLWTLATVLGCTLPGQAFGDEMPGYGINPQPVYLPGVIQQTSTYNNWDGGAQTASQPQPAPAPAEAPLPACDGSSCCAPGCQMVATVEGTFFFPQFNRSFLTNTLDNTLGDQTISSNSQSGSADGSLLAAPRITLGVQGECWGLVGRYWYGSASSSAFAPSVPGAATTGLIGADVFRAYTADLEAQRRFGWCNWDMYGFFGTRYAAVDNDRTLVSTNSFGGPSLYTSSFAGQQFNGAGITFGFMGTRSLWCDDSPWKLFFANRYSVLWGNGSVAAQTTATSIDTLGTLTSTNGAAASGQGNMCVTELQLGLQWEACLTCLPGRAFLRSAVEYQYWDGNVGVGANSNSFVTVVPTNTSATATASAGDFLFNLVGFNIGAGIMY